METRRHRRVPVWATGWQRRHYPSDVPSSDEDDAPTRTTPLRGRPTSGASTPSFGDPEIEEGFDDPLDQQDTTSRTSPSARSPTPRTSSSARIPTPSPSPSARTSTMSTDPLQDYDPWGSGAILATAQARRLRRHPDLGPWNSATGTWSGSQPRRAARRASPPDALDAWWEDHHDANFIERFDLVDDSDYDDEAPVRSAAPPSAVRRRGQAVEENPSPHRGRVASSYPPVFTGNRGESYKEWKRGVEFWILGEAGALPANIIGPRMMVSLQGTADLLVRHLKPEDVDLQDPREQSPRGRARPRERGPHAEGVPQATTYFGREHG